MVGVLTNSFNVCLDDCGENYHLADSRSRMLIPTSLINSIKLRDTISARELAINQKDSTKMWEIQSSTTSLKSIDRGVSEYWGNVLRYHWPIAIQSIFLVLLILSFGPWIGLQCNDDVSLPLGHEYLSIWRPLMGLATLSAPKSSTPSKRTPCTYGFFCANKRSRDDEPVRRRASFLRRKRNIKEFID